MSELRWVRLESAESGVRTLTLDRPPVNALGRELVDDLTVALARLKRDDEARCLDRSRGYRMPHNANLTGKIPKGLGKLRA